MKSLSEKINESFYRSVGNPETDTAVNKIKKIILSLKKEIGDCNDYDKTLSIIRSYTSTLAKCFNTIKGDFALEYELPSLMKNGGSRVVTIWKYRGRWNHVITLSDKINRFSYTDIDIYKLANLMLMEDPQRLSDIDVIYKTMQGIPFEDFMIQ